MMMKELEHLSKVKNFRELGEEIGHMTDVKNEKYGDSFNEAHRILEVLYPNGVKPKDYKNMLGITRVLDKLFRLSKGDQGTESAWRDIVGYGLLGEQDYQKTKKIEKAYKDFYSGGMDVHES